jgi:hypothetical protein
VYPPISQFQPASLLFASLRAVVPVVTLEWGLLVEADKLFSLSPSLLVTFSNLKLVVVVHSAAQVLALSTPAHGPMVAMAKMKTVPLALVVVVQHVFTR